MVGATLAALLARSGFSVALIEAREPREFDVQQPVGLRVSALSPGSASILSAAGTWAEIEKQRSCPYLRMRVEDAAHEVALDFEAPVFGLERLGTIVENDLVQSASWRVAGSHPLLTLYCPDALTAWRCTAHGTSIALESGAGIDAQLCIAADGSESALRRMAGIDQEVWDYGQRGVVCVVETEQPNPGTAWQRFMEGGPLAFLPLANGNSSIVWTRPAKEAERLLGLDQASFVRELDGASNRWAGRVKSCGPCASFPLSMRLSHGYIAERLVLLGDAAHVVHPLAGQGVNLGFADAAALTELLVERRQAGGDIGAHDLLARYERWRRSENSVMAGGIHALRSLFMTPAMSGLRALGMRLVGRSWMARDAFLQRAAGQGRNAPRLAKGADLGALMRGR